MMKHGSDTNKMFRELKISIHSSFHMYFGRYGRRSFVFSKYYTLGCTRGQDRFENILVQRKYLPTLFYLMTE